MKTIGIHLNQIVGPDNVLRSDDIEITGRISDGGFYFHAESATETQVNADGSYTETPIPVGAAIQEWSLPFIKSAYTVGERVAVCCNDGTWRPIMWTEENESKVIYKI